MELHVKARAAIGQRFIDLFSVDDCSMADFLSKALSQEYRDLVDQVRRYTGNWIQRIDLNAGLYSRIVQPILDSARAADVRVPFRISLSRQQTAAVADELLDWIESLPCSYDYFFPLPALGSFGQSMLEIGRRVALLDVSESNERHGGFLVVAAQQYAAASEAERSVMLLRDCRYIRIRAEGYHFLGAMSESAPASAFSMLRRVLVLGECAGVFRVVMRPEKAHQQVPLLSPTDTGLCGMTTLPRAVAEQIARYEFTVREAGEEEDRDEKLRAVTRALDSPHDTPGLANLFTAAEWLFDAEAENNQTISFIQTCIAFEALLGDQLEQEDRGVTASLADRLAFLLGRGVAERDEIRAKFKQYYRERSKIVHGRAAQLSDDAADLHYWGRCVLRRALASEMNALPGPL